MSGHSKWHNIRDKKSKVDSARGQVFTRASKEIHMAVKEGGGDPDNNFRLKIAIQRAKDVNMPADNIKRTIEKASGAGSADYEELLYEGYGPCGVALVIEVATDNRNRTAAEVRNVFVKSGCSLGESGCVSWMFKKKGLFLMPKGTDEEALMELALSAGAEDMESDDEGIEITCELSSFSAVKDAIDNAGVKYDSAEITWIPENMVSISEEDSAKVIKLIDALDALDDVQDVFSNFEVN